MTSKIIDIILELDAKRLQAGANKAVTSLAEIEKQANVTREKMEKLANVGAKVAVLGAAITAPFALAMKKYVDTAKETEPVSKKILDLSKRWEESQVRLGRVTAEIVLPLLTDAMDKLDKVVDFAEKHPDLVKAALTVGATLIVLGGIITTTAQVVSTLATIQGLLAGAGMAAAGGNVAVAAGGVTMAGISTFFTTVAVPALALAIGGQIGLWLGNWLMGTEQTWGDIWETVKRLPTVIGFGLTELGRAIFNGLADFGGLIVNGLIALGTSISGGFQSIAAGIGGFLTGSRADGGYVSSGIYRMGERGREFVLNNDTTRNAERAMGGQLSQNSARAYVTNNMQMGHGMTIAQTRRVVQANNRQLINSILAF